MVDEGNDKGLRMRYGEKKADPPRRMKARECYGKIVKH